MCHKNALHKELHPYPKRSKIKKFTFYYFFLLELVPFIFLR